MKSFTKHIIAVAIMLPVAAHAGNILKKLSDPLNVVKATMPPVEKALLEKTHQHAQDTAAALQNPSDLLNPKNAMKLSPVYQSTKLATQAPAMVVQAQIRQQQELWGSEPGINNPAALSRGGSVFSNTMRSAVQQANAAQQQPYGSYQGQAQLNMTNQAASQAQQMRQQADTYLDDYRRMVREDSNSSPSSINSSVLDRATTMALDDRNVHYIAPKDQILGTPSAMPIYANGQTLVTSNLNQGRLSTQRDTTDVVNQVDVGSVRNTTASSMDNAMSKVAGYDWYKKTAQAIGGNSSEPWNQQVSIWKSQYDQLNKQDTAQVEQWQQRVVAVIEGQRDPDVRPREADGSLWNQGNNSVYSNLSNPTISKPLKPVHGAAFLQEQAKQSASVVPVPVPTRSETVNASPAVRAPGAGRGVGRDVGLPKETEVDLRRFIEEKRGAANWLE